MAVDGPSPSHGAREARGREERVAARRCSVVFPSIRMNQELWSVQRLCESTREGRTEEDLAWTWAEEGARCREGRPWWCFPASPEIGADQPRASSRVNHRASSCQFAASLHGKKTPVAARAGGPACSLNKKGVPLSREGLIKLTRRGSLSVSHSPRHTKGSLGHKSHSSWRFAGGWQRSPRLCMSRLTVEGDRAALSGK